MSCVSSITDDDATADSTDPGMPDDDGGSSSDEEGPGRRAAPPPPPPHIELLALAPGDGDGGRRPLVRVVSYLDGAGRGSAAASCAVFREAADAWARERRRHPSEGREQRRLQQEEEERTRRGAREAEGRRREDERRKEKQQFDALAARRRSELERLEEEALLERESLDRLERERTAAERRLKEHVESERGRNILEGMDDLEESVARHSSPRATRPPSSEEEEGEEGEEEKVVARAAAAEPAVVKRRTILEEMDELEESLPELSPPRAAWPPSLDDEEHGVDSLEKEADAPGMLAGSPKSILSDLGQIGPKRSLPRPTNLVSYGEDVDEDEAIVPKRGAHDAPALLLGARSESNPSPDDEDTAEPRELSRISKLASSDEDEDEAIVPRQGVRDAPAPLLAASSEDDVSELAELKSLSTVDMKAQGDAFLARVSSSGAWTPLSFHAYQSFTDSPIRTALSSDHEEEGPDDEHLAQPTASSSHNMNPSPGTSVAPVFDTPSAASLVGATRLVMGSAGHLGNRSELPIVDRVRQIEEGAQRASNAMLTHDSKAIEPSTMERESQAQVFAPPPKFTSLRDVLGAADDEEIPFDEMPGLSISTSSETAPYETSHEPPRSIREPRASKRREYAPDVLTQLSDAAIFGETPRVLAQTPRIVTDFVSDIFDSAKEVVSHLSLRSDGAPRRNRIDDNGPIKIGDRYYSHNEALRKWRKAKVKLNDQYHALDKDTALCEGNSVFQEEPKRGEADAVNVRYESKQLDMEKAEEEAVPIGELVARLKHLEKRTESNQSQSTVMAGNIQRGDIAAKEEVVPISELVMGYKPLEKRSESIQSQSTVMAGNIVRGDIAAKEEAAPIDKLTSRYKPLEKRSVSMERQSIVMAGNKLRVDKEPEESDKLERLPVVEESKEENTTYSEATETGTESEMYSTDSSNNLDSDNFTSRLFEDIFSEASHVESRFEDITSEDSDSDSKDEDIILKKSIQLTRARARGSSAPPQAGGDKAPAPADSSGRKFKHEADSVAGENSLPSHMGVEVTSIRGMTANFISGKSSEQVKIGEGRNIQKDGEQSVLGSQYGTEVVFKAKKVVAARKPRTLAGHNMSVTASKQTGAGPMGAAARQANAGFRGGAGAKGSSARHGENHQRARPAERATGKSAPQTNSGASGHVKTSSKNKGSPASSKQHSQGNTGIRPAPMRSASIRMKLKYPAVWRRRQG